jgi:hypothetical protein
MHTIGQSGWLAEFNVVDTELEEKPFTTVSKRNSEDDWLEFYKQGYKLQAKCGLVNLPEVFNIFRTWAEKKETAQEDDLGAGELGAGAA